MNRTFAESRDILTSMRAAHREDVLAGKPSLASPATQALRASMLADGAKAGLANAKAMEGAK